MLVLAFVLLVASSFEVLGSAQFSATSPNDGETFALCDGETLVLPWNLTLAPGDVIDNIKWYSTDHTNVMELIATSTNDMFMPVPAYSNRLKFLENGGLLLSHVAEGDAGIYTVDVVGHDSSGTAFTLKRSAQLEIQDSLHTTDHRLHVTYDGVPVQDSNGRWSVRFLCGNFTYPSHPPFDVEWRLPSIRYVNGTSYENGHFVLWLSAPVENGYYICSIPPESRRAACLHSNNQHGEDSKHVDGVGARMTLVEAHLTSLQKENDALRAENTQLKTDQVDSTHNLNQRIEFLESQLQPAKNNSQLLISQGSIRSRGQASFYARGLSNTYPAFDDTLIVNDVIVDDANAYNSTNGYYKAPYNGMYFFSGTLGFNESTTYAHFALFAEGRKIADSWTDRPKIGEMATLHGIVRLKQGQQALLKVLVAESYDPEGTSFSGYLMYAD